MSNVVDGNPLILVTAADNLVSPRTNVKISKLLWVPSAVDQVVQLENGEEIVVWERNTTEIGTLNNAILPQPSDDFNPPLMLTGLSLGVLTSGGVLYVYLAEPIG